MRSSSRMQILYLAEGTATTGVSSLEVEVETSQMMHIDVWSALEEPLKSRVKECQIDSHRLTLGECVGVGRYIVMA